MLAFFQNLLRGPNALLILLLFILLFIFLRRWGEPHDKSKSD